MGIARGAVKLFMQEGLRKPLTGKILHLGKQDVWIRKKELQEIALQMKYSLKPCDESEFSLKPEMREEKFISDVFLARSLGFSECRSLDYSDYEKADFLFDLNAKDLPSHLENSFDVIFDGGTIEHVFHVPQALENIFRMLKVGGRIIHISPSSNHIDHGFYMFSPTLFADFYQANHFEINRLIVIRHAPQGILPWKIKEYEPGCLNEVSYGGLDEGMYAIGCIATKGLNSSGNQIPQQRNYLYGGWKKEKQKRKKNLFETLKKTIKRQALFYSFFSRVKNALLKKKVIFNETF